MSKRNGRLTQKDLERLDREFREVTRHGFDGGKYGAWLDDASTQVGVDPDQLASRLTAAGLRAALASYEAHKQSTADLYRSVRGEQRRRLRRRLDQVGEEQGYRSQVALVRALRSDLGGRSIRAFLEARVPAGRARRPLMAARAPRPSRSSSSSRTAGTDPGDDDPDAAGLTSPHGRRHRRPRALGLADDDAQPPPPGEEAARPERLGMGAPR